MEFLHVFLVALWFGLPPVSAGGRRQRLHGIPSLIDDLETKLDAAVSRIEKLENELAKCCGKQKPGVCPNFPDDLITICPVLCKNDFECKGKDKCCKKGCMITCVPPVAGCTVNGKTYAVGESFKDDCNTCTCGENGLAACTKKACPPANGCTYNGKKYDSGDSFKSKDGCNTCTCTENGLVACTRMACIKANEETKK